MAEFKENSRNSAKSMASFPSRSRFPIRLSMSTDAYETKKWLFINIFTKFYSVIPETVISKKSSVGFLNICGGKLAITIGIENSKSINHCDEKVPEYP